MQHKAADTVPDLVSEVRMYLDFRLDFEDCKQIRHHLIQASHLAGTDPGLIFDMSKSMR